MAPTKDVHVLISGKRGRGESEKETLWWQSDEIASFEGEEDHRLRNESPPLEARRGKKTDSTRPLKRNAACQHLILTPETHFRLLTSRTIG